MRTRALTALLAGLLLAGCGSYHLGAGNGETRSVEIRPVRNATPMPGVHAALQQALVSAFSADHRLGVRDGGEPLETEVVSVERAAATRSPDDALITGQFRVTLTVRCTLRSADGKQVRFANRPFSATAILSASGNLAGEERGVMPRLAAELAAQIRDASAGAW